MAAHLLRLFGATVAASILALLGLLAALRAASPAAGNPTEFATLALATGVAEQAHLVIPAIASLGAILAGGAVLFLAAVGVAAARSRWLKRTVQPDPTLHPAMSTEGRERR